MKLLAIVVLAVAAALAQTDRATQPIGTSVKPRVFLQAASKGNNQNAARDQAMEMSKDLEQDCPGVRITIYQQNADYTVLLNHIEVGLLIRDNQFQLADRNGDLLSKTKEGGSIRNGMKKVCARILDDWAKIPPQPAPAPAAADPEPSRPAERAVPPPPATPPPPASPDPQLAASSTPGVVISRVPIDPGDHAIGVTPAPQSEIFRDATIGAFFEGNPEVRRNGMTVTAITPGGPAEQAGMKAGDVVTAINDRYLYTIRDLTQEITRYQPGTAIRIRYRRYTAVNEATVVVGQVQ